MKILSFFQLVLLASLGKEGLCVSDPVLYLSALVPLPFCSHYCISVIRLKPERTMIAPTVLLLLKIVVTDLFCVCVHARARSCILVCELP